MTWSILVRDKQGHFGMAIASRFFAVGSLCVHSQREVGCLSTQALTNPTFGAAGLRAMAAGLNGADTIRTLLAADEGRDHRQVHVLPAHGPAAAHTGALCIDWCGHLTREGLSVAGNMLAGPQVIEATADAYAATEGLPLAERLLAAMEAGEAAGGDKRGKQAAALFVQEGEDYLSLNIRVDDHAEPLTELRRLYEVSLHRALPFRQCLPGRGRPSGVIDRAEIEAHIERFHAQRHAAQQAAA